MNGESVMPSALVGCILGALALCGNGCALPQKPAEEAGKAEGKANAEAEAGRKEEERKRLEADLRAQAEKKRLDADLRAQVEKEYAEKEKQEQAAAGDSTKKKGEWKRNAEESRTRDAEAKAKWLKEARAEAEKANEEMRKAQEANREKERVQRVKAYLADFSRNVETVYCFADENTPPGSDIPIDEDYQKLAAMVTGRGEWTLKDSGRNRSVVRFARLVLNAEARNEKVNLNPDPVLALIPQMTTADVLLDIHNNFVPPAMKKADAVEEAARRQRVISNARVNMGLRSLESADQRFEALGAGDLVGNDNTQWTRIHQEGERAIAALKAEIPAYWKAVNQVRRAQAERELLKGTLEACRARLIALGVPAEQLTQRAAPEKKAESRSERPVTIYMLKDGREIRAVVAVEMDDQLSLMDEAGKIQNVFKADITRTKKQSP
jgi:hypothetical protein